MELRKVYDELYEKSLNKFKNNQFEYDSLINSENDRRYGLTAIIRPSENIRNKIIEIQQEIKSIDNKQYFYPAEDMHITLLSIISCFQDFDLDSVETEKYIELIRNALYGFKSFNIKFSGITASTSCLMIQGFPENDQINLMRNKLRETFQNSKLFSSIDQRYNIKTSHITFVRFREQINNHVALINLCNEIRNRDIGDNLISEVEFVFNDWYMKKEKVKLIKKFNLG